MGNQFNKRVVSDFAAPPGSEKIGPKYKNQKNIKLLRQPINKKTTKPSTNKEERQESIHANHDDEVHWPTPSHRLLQKRKWPAAQVSDACTADGPEPSQPEVPPRAHGLA